MTKVLLIEDDEDLALITGTLVSGEGYEFERTSTVDEAITSCEAEAPAVALVDVQLPERSGWEFVEEASRWPNMRVVVYTVHSDEPETIERAKRLKIDALVGKSDDPMKLVDVIRRVVHN